MSSYDPTQDPRFIPIDPDLPLQERDRLEEMLGDIEENIQLFDQALVMFQHPGWNVIERMFDATMEQLDHALRREQDQSVWKFYRGQLAQIEWFQTLPQDMANRQRNLRRDHAQILRELGRE